MRRQNLLFILLVAMGLVVGSCGKKSAPESIEDTTPVQSMDDTSSDMSEMGTDDMESTDPGVLANLPTIYFGFDESNLSSEARSTLQAVAEGLKADASARLTIEGHCDERGSNEYNLALGERRARSIQDYLTRLGVSSSSLTIVSYGEERPADMGSSESAWAKNRRAELVVSR